MYGWQLDSDTASLQRHYGLRSHLPRVVAVVLVEVQIREVGRAFDVQAWERARLARLRGVAA